jgi:hypothetical protein
VTRSTKPASAAGKTEHTMTACKQRERLLKFQQEAFGEWYKLRSELEKFENLKEYTSIIRARRAADKAYKKLRLSMDALVSHDREHKCCKGRK